MYNHQNSKSLTVVVLVDARLVGHVDIPGAYDVFQECMRQVSLHFLVGWTVVMDIAQVMVRTLLQFDERKVFVNPSFSLECISTLSASMFRMFRRVINLWHSVCCWGMTSSATLSELKYNQRPIGWYCIPSNGTSRPASAWIVMVWLLALLLVWCESPLCLSQQGGI